VENLPPPSSPLVRAGLGGPRHFAVSVQTRSEEVERCEFCDVPLPIPHRHLWEPGPHQFVCACDACALLFDHAIGGRFTLTPREVGAS